MKDLILCLLIVSISHFVGAQQKYWIYPKDKMVDSFAFYEHAKVHNVNPIITSYWLNAYSTHLDSCQAINLKSSPYINSITPINSKIVITSNSNIQPYQLTKALDQLHADTLINLGLDGRNIKVGIIDAGFLDADKDVYLKGLIENNKIMGYQNFIEADDVTPYDGNSSYNDAHGTLVFKALAGKSKEIQSGLATGAEFYLARTDQSDKEYRAEEDYWIAALEWMHSQGVKLVNSSIGYSDGYDDSAENYSPKQVDGKSSAITKATEIAVKEKGMTIILSAGNDGNKPFRIISIPCDAKGIIAVGSSGYRYWEKLDFSSIGPEHLADVKPELACYGAGGTSFAAPIITGLVACMLQKRPSLSNDEIITILEKSAHLYPYPNNYLGYGIPDVRKVLKLLDNPNLDVHKSIVLTGNEKYILILPKSHNIMAFHKKDNYLVLHQEKLRWQNGQVEIIKPQGAKFTTITNGNYVWELKWQDEIK